MAAQNPLELTAFPQLWTASIDYLNGMLTTFVPGGELYLVAGIAFVISYSLKYRYKWGMAAFLLSTIILFAAFRYFNLGGPLK